MEIVYIILFTYLLRSWILRGKDPIDRMPDKKFDRVIWKEYANDNREDIND